MIRLKIKMLIKELRKERNMSLDELSKKTNISKSHLNYIERNEKEPTISMLIKISNSLNVEITELYKVEW